MALTKQQRKADLFAYYALLYAAGMLFFCGLIPEWGKWYSASGYHREQTRALLHGNFVLSNDPKDLATDLCWSGGGVQQVWGLGIPLWRSPFEAAAELFKEPPFPDRIALGLFMALTAYVTFLTWLGAKDNSESLGLDPAPPRRWSAYGAIILSLFFAATINLLRTRMDHYYEVLAYLAFFGIMQMCGIVSIARNPSWKKFWGLSLLSGFGGLIRPTLVFYAFATFCIAGLVTWHHERERRKFDSATRQWTTVGAKLLAGALLCAIGGMVLFATNYLRFGNGFEFGHKLNVSRMLPSIYSTRFDYPFKYVPLKESGRELFGALFQIEQFNGNDFYKREIFSGQSPTIRARKFNYTTYDLSYAIGLCAAWIGGIWVTLKWLWPRRQLHSRDQASRDFIPLPGVLIMWSILASLPLIVFYLKTHAIGDRYMGDFVPAFSAALIGLWLFTFDAVLAWTRHRKFIASGFYLILIGWQAYEITSAKSGWGSPLSVTTEDVIHETRAQAPPFQTLQNEYRSRATLLRWGIPLNGQGWEMNGEVQCCGIFYVDSPRFLELEMALAAGRKAEEAPVTEMKARIGLEKLDRSSIIHTNDTWVLRFSGPDRRRYQEGIQPAFVAFVPGANLGNFVTNASPWILKRITWRR